jgi:hypothetical protein
MGNANVRRYMGGKQPQKYYNDDIWPANEDLFTKLGFNRTNGFKLFKAFTDMDVDESSTVDLDECFAYIGGNRTRLNERIFDVEGKTNAKEGLPYGAFALVLWNFGTFSPSHLARYLFEIYDPENRGTLQRPDIQSMYRMCHGLESTENSVLSKREVKAVALFPFDPDSGDIYKTAFINYASRHAELMRPVLRYQNTVRRRMGGKKLWVRLMHHRQRLFADVDNMSRTLQDALAGIVSMPNPNKALERAEALLLREKLQMEKEIAALEAQQLALEKERLRKEKMQAKQSEDRLMNEAWQEFESAFLASKHLQFTLERHTDRAATRTAMFSLLDKANEMTIAYWRTRDARDLQMKEETAEDKDNRLQVFIADPAGQKELDRAIVTAVICFLAQKYSTKSSRPSGREAVRLGQISDCQEKLKHFAEQSENHRAELLAKAEEYAAMRDKEETLEEKATKQAAKHFDEMALDVQSDWACAHKYATRQEINTITVEARASFAHEVWARQLKQTELDIQRSTEERRRNAIRKEFEVVTELGNRHTVWEHVFDSDQNKNVIFNTETGQTLHYKTAVCERCDQPLVQSEIKCGSCGAARSAKNLRLFRPLGMKEYED